MRNETFQYHTIICNHRFPASLAVALVLQFLCRKAGEDCNLPDEIRESKKIVNDREQIMQNARIESESIIQQAEERARVLTSEQEIVKRSQQHAAEILSAAQKSAKELTRKATLYCETILKNSEEVLGRSMADIKNTRMNLRSAARPKNNMPK